MSDRSDAHPAVEALRQFVSGQVDETQLQEIESHLTACETCRSTISALTADDGLAVRLRCLAEFSYAASHSPIPGFSAVRELLGQGQREPDVTERVRQAGQLGDYRILREVGRGGMGVVFEAEQISLGRRVALKVLLNPELADQGQRERFRREAESVATLHHANIVPIFGIGEHEGVPYFVMQFIDGVTLDAKTSEGSDSSRVLAYDWGRAVEIGRQAAVALDYAHNHGILHRDIKPGNLILDESETVWLTDFGLAKVDDERDLTRTGSLLGTLRYMAPEAFQGNADVRSEVYSLGLTIYELVAGQPAIEATNRVSLIERIQNPMITRLSIVRPGIPSDLETVIHKSIDREPSSRYQTAAEFAADLRRLLDNEPVHARRVSHAERMWRWTNSNRTLAASLTGIACLLLTGVIAAGMLAAHFRHEESLQRGLAETNGQLAEQKAELLKQKANEARRANRSEQEAIAARRLAEELHHKAEESRARAEEHARNLQRTLYATQMLIAGQSAASASGVEHVQETTAKWHPDVVLSDWRGWEWYYLASHCDRAELTVVDRLSPLYWATWNPSGQSVAMAGDRRTIQIFDADTGQITRSLSGHASSIRCVQWSPDGTHIASTGGTELIVWDAGTGDLKHRITDHRGTVNRVAWSPDGVRLASGSESEIRIWDVTSAKLIRVIDAPGGSVKAISWHPNGTRIAAPHGPASVSVWKVNDGSLATTFSGHAKRVLAVRWSPTGTLLASTGQDSTVRIWSVPGNKELRSWKLNEVARTIDWSPDQQQLLVSGDDGAARLLRINRAGTILEIHGHTNRVASAAFNHDGSRLVTASADSSVRIWETRRSPHHIQIDVHENEVEAVAWSPDGSRLASASADHTIAISDPTTGEVQHRLRGQKSHLSCIQWNGSGTRVASGAWDGTIVVWDAESGVLLRELRFDAQPVEAVCWNSAGTCIFGGSTSGGISIWDAESGDLLDSFSGHQDAVLGLALSHDGSRLASCSADRTLRIWNVETRECQLTALLSRQRLNQVAWSPDDRQLVTVGADAYMRVYDVVAQRERYRIRSDNSFTYFVNWSPDGKRIATGGTDGSVKLWDAETGERTLTLGGMNRAVRGVEFSPDGTCIAAASRDFKVRVWDATRAYETERSPRKHDGGEQVSVD